MDNYKVDRMMAISYLEHIIHVHYIETRKDGNLRMIQSRRAYFYIHIMLILNYANMRNQQRRRILYNSIAQKMKQSH